jgi:hypothetical protein
LETHGPSVPVVSRVPTGLGGAGEFALATDGTLVHVDAQESVAASARTLVWVDRAGNEEAIAAAPRAYGHPRLSPDGTRVALWISDQEDDIWILDLARAPLTRLTNDAGMDRFPVWTPDSKRSSLPPPVVDRRQHRRGKEKQAILRSQAKDGSLTAMRSPRRATATRLRR